MKWVNEGSWKEAALVYLAIGVGAMLFAVFMRDIVPMIHSIYNWFPYR